ncbi:WGR domain-containing protein [Persicimonas caeni]|uniref:WGR domain-containing protein n=1 Tax=Persicimonas caeni TaxID=2292766 RepID=UPI00143D83F5|nr:WGR domain-containing protein [Persicimonas caeni]
MKLIRQTKLHYRSGKSDKVYEVDLCEAGDGEFVVNFRYGRRGTTLREGTKTPFPESRAKADQIFDDLVASKVKKGYKYTSESSSLSEVPSSPRETAADTTENDPRVTATLRRIQRAARGEPAQSDWKLSRAIWTAGAWKLSQAADAIAQLAMQSDDHFLVWSSVWALGRCGTGEHVQALDVIEGRESASASLRSLARVAKMMLADDAQRQRFADAELAKLPGPARAGILAEDKAELFEALLAYLRNDDADKDLGSQLFAVAMDRPWVREAIHELVCELAPNERSMAFLRRTLKAAEMVMDAELYGALVKKFETSPGRGSARWNWRKSAWGRAPAFSSKTKAYFQRRFVRHLRRLGESGRPELFIPLATGVLLSNDDQIQQPSEDQRVDWRWDWDARRYQRIEQYAPRYSKHHCFIWLLRGEGQSLHRPGGALRWWYRDGAERGHAARREEPFGELWDQAPDAILHLMRHARSEEVQRFAVRVFRANPAFEGEVDNALLGDLLQSWCDATAELALELAKVRWDPNNPDGLLLLAVLRSKLAEARTLGLQWLDRTQHTLGKDASFLAGLAFLQHDDVRERARSFAKTLYLGRDEQKRVVGLVVSALVSMTDPDDESVAAHAADFVLLIAGDVLSEVAGDHVAELLAHPLEGCQQLGVRALLGRSSLNGLPDALLLAPLSSEYGSVRRLGMQLLQRLSDLQLAERADLIAGFGTSEYPELRQEARPLIERLVAKDAELGRDLVERWYPLLLREEQFEGLHGQLYELLTDPLGDYLDAIPDGSFRRMLTLKYAHAQLLGFELLKREVRLVDEPLDTLIEWASHELLVLREAVRAHFARFPQRLRSNPGAMMPMLETNWDDTREWAFEFCRDEIPEEAWDPEALVAICDSVDERVQSFGREMITRRFRAEHGHLYLQRLSEHPTVELQIFATNYLTRFAADDPEALQSLDHYFRAVLSKIGAGRVAKDRVLAFLEAEAAKDVEAARYVEGLLRRQVATVSVTDKAACIKVLAKVRRQWPELPSALTRNAPSVYSPEAN